jgi:hypothetical protein
MTQPPKDRDYYRALETKELLEEARTGVRVNWHELAVVLCERIYDNRWENGTLNSHCPECGAELD